jgi:hypothetical protein
MPCSLPQQPQDGDAACLRAAANGYMAICRQVASPRRCLLLHTPSDPRFDDDYCSRAKRQLRLERWLLRWPTPPPSGGGEWTTQRQTFQSLMRSNCEQFWQSTFDHQRICLINSVPQLTICWFRDHFPARDDKDTDSFHELFDHKMAAVRGVNSRHDTAVVLDSQLVVGIYINHR